LSDYYELLAEARLRFQMAYEGEEDIRRDALDDLLNIEGSGIWPAQLRKARSEATPPRPCITIPKLAAFVDQVTGDMRQNKPSIKVRPNDDKSDPETADILEGLIRNIEQTSMGDIAYIHAGECAAASSFGYFRIYTDYATDDSFEQDIKIKRIANQFSVYTDPRSVEWDLSDAQFQFIVERISREEYKRKFPDKEPSDYTDVSYMDYIESWQDENTIRIAEYFCRVPVIKNIVRLSDGAVWNKKDLAEFAKKQGMGSLEEFFQVSGLSITKERKVKTTNIERYLIDGTQILEDKQIWPSKYFPAVPCYGKEMWIGEKKTIRSVIRNAKDSNRLYSYRRTVTAERLSLIPKAPFLLTVDQIKGHEEMWKRANTDNMAYLLYNADQFAQKPTREPPVLPDAGNAQELQIDAQELKETTSIFDASLGQKSNETSGKAILARQREGDTATYSYQDNLARAVKLGGLVILDLIPTIYDTERVIRVRGLDDSEKFVKINGPYEEKDKAGAVVQKFHDLTVGKYDVTITVGPSYATKRLEAADSMIGFIQAMPNTAPMVADLVAGSMDWPDADKFQERLKKTLPPGLADDDKEDPDSPEAIAKKQKEDAEQAQVAQIQQMGMQKEQLLLEQEAAKLEKLRLEAEKLKVEIAQLQVKGAMEADEHRRGEDMHRMGTDKHMMEFERHEKEMNKSNELTNSTGA
jgi:hypothetical protein